MATTSSPGRSQRPVSPGADSAAKAAVSLVPSRWRATASTSPDLAVPEAVDLVRAHWENEDEFTTATLDKCGETIARFARRLRAQGVTDLTQISASHCQTFIGAPTPAGQAPALTTRHARRRTALRMLFRTLRAIGHDIGDPALDLSLPARSDTSARPLTDLEVTLCRASSRMAESGGRSLHRAVCWALGETSAVTSEISAIRVGDVYSLAAPRWVRLPGTRRHDPRLGELFWGSAIIARQLRLLAQRHATPSSLLTYRGQGLPGEHTAQSAVCNAIGGVLQLSGVGAEPDVRPASLRNWAGRRLYDAGMPIEQVARRLGARSLDAVASDIALTWRTDP